MTTTDNRTDNRTDNPVAGYNAIANQTVLVTGVAVASSIAAAHFRTFVHHGHTTAAALTGGFQWALWVSGLTALAAVPVTLLLFRRGKMALPVSTQQAPASTPTLDAPSRR